MDNPPTPKDIEQALAELREPVERRLVQIQDLRDRYVEHHRQTAALVDPAFVEQSKRLRTSVREHQRKVDRFPQGVIRTLVLCNPETDDLNAIALVQEQADVPALRVSGWSVSCVRCSLHLLRCKVGEFVPQGLVVSVDGSPILEKPHRRRAIDALRAPPVAPHEQKRRENLGRKIRLERFLTERRIREQVWQEQLFQRRRAVEQREQLLQEKLRREQMEKEEAHRRALEEWDRERELLLHGHSESSELEAGDGTPVDELSVIASTPADGEAPEDEAEVAARLAREMPEPSSVGIVLLVFACGCTLGLFVMPKAFSLVGAAIAAVVAQVYRLMNRRR